MKARPILMNGPMVRSTLADIKTNTRRLNGLERFTECGTFLEMRKDVNGDWVAVFGDSIPGDTATVSVKSPYGQPGDRLWVKETIRLTENWHDGAKDHDVAVYVADGAPTSLDRWTWQRHVLPSIHCPRFLSRITLEIVSVRVERLQEITEADAIAEGVQQDRGRDVPAAMGGGVTPWRCYLDEGEWYSSPITSYRSLWESINGPGSWAANPWVWRIEFKRVIE